MSSSNTHQASSWLLRGKQRETGLHDGRLVEGRLQKWVGCKGVRCFGGGGGGGATSGTCATKHDTKLLPARPLGDRSKMKRQQVEKCYNS